MSEKIYHKVKKYIDNHQMINPGDIVAAGVSGGADSVCMLHILWRLRKEYAYKLAVVHVDHGVRADSGQDAEYVAQLCREWEIPFYLKKVDMEGYAKSRKISSEEAGRTLRYEAFGEVLKQCLTEDREPGANDREGGEAKAAVAHNCEGGKAKTAVAHDCEGGKAKAAVAHNCDDRAETMLFHLMRGSGLKGICSIQPVRENIIRPILCLERSEIEEYLEEEGLVYREDSTNQEDTYTRNKIRHHIMPYAEREICARAVEHMGSLADILSETESYMEGQTRRAYERCVSEERELCGYRNNVPGEKGMCAENDGACGTLRIELAELKREPQILQKRILLMCLESLTPHRRDITGQHVADIMGMIEREGSKRFSLPYGLSAYKEYGRLYLGRLDFMKETADKKDAAGMESEEDIRQSSLRQVYDIMPPDRLELPRLGVITFDFVDMEGFLSKKQQIIPENRYTKWFDYDKITTSLQMRTRRAGDYLTIDDALHTKKLKDYMINEKIPKILRDDIYILADGAHILWIPGYRISQYYKVEENTKRILRVQLKGGSNGRTD